MAAIQIKNLDQEFEALINKAHKEADKEFRAKIFQTYADLKEATPVDTGRARNSWSVNVRPGVFNSNGSGKINAGQPGETGGKNKTIYITNGTPYIERLNDGYSKQAPPLFIDAVIKRYFPELKGKVVDTVKR